MELQRNSIFVSVYTLLCFCFGCNKFVSFAMDIDDFY